MPDTPPKRLIHPILAFLKPNWLKVLLFLLLIFLMPGFYLRTEPLTSMANSPWQWKFEIIESLFTDVFVGYASSFDVFLSMVDMHYLFNNLIGVPLLLLYYLTACAISLGIARLIHPARHGPFRVKTSE